MSKRGRWRDRDELPVVWIENPAKRMKREHAHDGCCGHHHDEHDHHHDHDHHHTHPKDKTSQKKSKMELEDEDLVPQNILHSGESESESSEVSGEDEPEHLHHQPSESDESTESSENSGDVPMEVEEEQPQKPQKEVEAPKASRRNPKSESAPSTPSKKAESAPSTPSKKSSIQVQNDPSDAISQDAKRLFFGKLGPQVTDPVLRKWLAQFGTTESTMWAKDKVTGKPYGTCFIEMSSSQETAAILGAQQSVLDVLGSEQLRIAIAKNDEQRLAPGSKPAVSQAQRFPVFVGNVPDATTTNDLRDHLAFCGTIVDVKLVYDRNTRAFRHSAFVTFATKEAQTAALGLDDTQRKFKTNKLIINEARK